MAQRALDVSAAADFIFAAIRGAHEREPFVGGLLNAYEPAIHYELFNSALAHGLADTWQEASLGKGQTSCDLVFPLTGRGRLWLEVKMWWFLHHAYDSKYVNYAKTKGWPLLDWDRLADRDSGSHRALLLLRIWDCAEGKAKADDWLTGLTPRMTGAPPPLFCPLRERTYPSPNAHTRTGDAVLWSSTLG